MSPTEVNPLEVNGFTVQLVAWKTQGSSPVAITRLRLNRNFDATVTGQELQKVLGGVRADFVGAIVMYDEPTETITDYAPILADRDKEVTDPRIAVLKGRLRAALLIPTVST